MPNTAKPGSALCRIEGCGRPSSTRGCCSPCYTGLRKKVLEGVVTDQQLVDIGLFAHRKRNNMFSVTNIGVKTLEVMLARQWASKPWSPSEARSTAGNGGR